MRYMIVGDSKYYGEADTAKEAIDICCQHISANRSSLERQMKETNSATATYGFCNVHIYQNPTWSKKD